MSKFKVGDKVRRITGNHNGMVAGQVGTVIGTDSDDNILLAEFMYKKYSLELPKEADWHYAPMFEPVDHVSDLETAVKNVNNALAALHALPSEELKQVESKVGGWFTRYSLSEAEQTEFRIKPKASVFESYTIESTRWRVSYDKYQRVISIGCRDFSIEDLVEKLKHLLDGNPAPNNGLDLKVSRKGIVYRGDVLPWEAAEELYERIKSL